MSSLFDDLNRKLQAEQREQGMSAWDLAQLPPRLRKVVRTVLRRVEISYPELYQATVASADDASDEASLSPAELDSALQHLLQQAWLVRAGEGEPATYRVNLRRKRPSRLSSSLWDLLDSRIASSASDS